MRNMQSILETRLKNEMPRGIYIAGGLVMCHLTNVRITRVIVDDDGVILDFRHRNTSSRFPIGILVPLITASGAAALQSDYWPECEAMLERDRERFAEMANLEHFRFALVRARRILVGHILAIVNAAGMIACMRLPEDLTDWSHRSVAGLREVIEGVDKSKLPEFLMGITLNS